MILTLLLLPFVVFADGSVDEFIERMRTLPEDAPTYPLSLTLAFDGPANLPRIDPHIFRAYNYFVGRTTAEDVINMGRKAAKYFKRQYGIDFSDVPDDVLLGFRNVTTYNGAVTFMAGALSPKPSFRLVTFSGPHFAIKYNNFVADGSWTIRFNKPYKSKGDFKQLLPAGSSSSFGTYAVKVDKSLEQKIGLPEPLGPILLLDYRTRTVQPPDEPTTGARFQDLIIESEFLGRGIARGVLVPLIADGRKLKSDTVYSGRIVITIPEAVPFALPAQEKKYVYE